MEFNSIVNSRHFFIAIDHVKWQVENKRWSVGTVAIKILDAFLSNASVGGMKKVGKKMN